MNTPLVSALSLNFRNGRAAVGCVDNFLQQTVADQMEIIVIDNHSNDDSVGILRARLPHDNRIRVVESPRNDGFGAGYNYGARYAAGTYLLINNPDKKLEPDGIEKMIAKMEAEPDIGILAPKILHNDGTRRYSARAFPRPLDVVIKRTFLQKLFPHRLDHYLQLSEHPDAERSVDWVIGGCFLMRRDFFVELGGFDDRFFLFFEDIDLCKRCCQSGKRVVYFPAVTALDKKRRLSDGSAWSMITSAIGRAHIRSAMRYFWKWRGHWESASSMA